MLVNSGEFDTKLHACLWNFFLSYYLTLRFNKFYTNLFIEYFREKFPVGEKFVLQPSWMTVFFFFELSRMFPLGRLPRVDCLQACIATRLYNTSTSLLRLLCCCSAAVAAACCCSSRRPPARRCTYFGHDTHKHETTSSFYRLIHESYLLSLSLSVYLCFCLCLCLSLSRTLLSGKVLVVSFTHVRLSASDFTKVNETHRGEEL